MRSRVVALIMAFAFLAWAGTASGQQTEYVKINFQPEADPVPAGYIKDYGLAFTAQNGFEYGFDQDIFETRNRNDADSPDERYDTLNHFQKTSGRYWEITVPSGVYNVFLVCGDPSNNDMDQNMDVEGVICPDPDGRPAGRGYDFDEFTIQNLPVTDGRLTIKPAANAVNSKLCFVEIYTVDLSFNPAPVVSAGDDQAVYVGEAAQLSGTISDTDPMDGSYTGTVTSHWVGPAVATFSPADTTNILEPTVTFSAAGVYDLLLQASDGQKDANDIVTIVVKDHANEKMIAYYPLDNDANDATGGGRDLTAYGDTSFGAGVLGQAAVFDGLGDYLTQDDPNYAVGKLLNDGKGLTVSCWVKSNVYDTDRGFIIFQKPIGNDEMDMRYDEAGATGGGDAVLKMGVTTTNGIRQLETFNKSQSTAWQHVVLTWEAAGRIRGYVDGIEEYTAQAGVDPASAAMSGFGGLSVGLGGKDIDTQAQWGWDGMVDDVRIYNYALTPAEVLDLTAMGPVVAVVDAGQDVEFSWKPGRGLPLAGTVTDNGRPDGGTTYEWTTVVSPEGTTNVATFTPADSPTTEAQFPAAGVYVLQLAVNDPDAAAPVLDTVTITVIKPTCDDVKADGLMLANDLNGDCYVNLADLAIILADYPGCNDPIHEVDWGCEWPF